MVDQPNRLVTVAALGLGLTLWGWFRAGSFLFGHASFRPLAPVHSDGAKEHRPGGLGGIPLLLGGVFIRAFMLGLAVLVAIAVLRYVKSGSISWVETLKSVCGLGCFLSVPFIVHALAPALTHLRLLRTMPLSVTRAASSG